MKTVRAAALLPLLLSAPVLAAEIALPQPSPAATVSLAVGTTDVRIDYHRPGVKGREIWGKLVPYGEIWRLGANDATKLTVTDPFTLAGKELSAGSYSLFAIPGEKSWKIVVNSEPEQWGAYFHKPELDVHAFEVAPQAAPFAEWMDFAITPKAPGTAEVAMSWEKLRVAFEVAVDVDGLVWKKIDAAVADPAAGGFDPWTTYYQAAKYSLATGARKDDAWKWLEKAKGSKSSFRNHELEADLLARDGRFAEAVPALEKAIEMSAAAGAPDAWRAGARAKAAEWTKAKR